MTQQINLKVIGKWVAVAALLIYWWSTVSTLDTTSATYDEPEYLARGFTYLTTGDTSLKLRHPILVDVLASWPMTLLPEVTVPEDALMNAAGNFHIYAAQFMWEHNGASIIPIFFLARLPIIFFALLMISVVFVWSKRLFGAWGGMIAVIVAVFDPNLLAHGRLVTPDVGQSMFIFAATYAFWHHCRTRSWRSMVMAGVVLGLAQTAGYPALILYPLWVLMAFVTDWPKHEHVDGWLTRAWRIIADWFGDYTLVILVSAVTIWAVYGFRWGGIDFVGFAGPAPYYFAEFFDLLDRLGREDISYLNGEVYRGGRAFFFVVALLIKTPIPLLVMTVVTTIVLLAKRRFLPHIFVWLIPIFYYVVALNSSLNIGYRHLFPILPFLYVYAGGIALMPLKERRWLQTAVAFFLLWMVWGAAQIYPYHLTFFNEFAGGPENGSDYLVVSDLDWGQDLIGLQQYMANNGVDEVFLSYFGTAAPERYGIPHRDLPAWPPRGIPGQLPYHPNYPLPGTYAISVANLVGSHFEEARDTFDYFLQHSPTAVIGNSIYIYDVPEWGDALETSLVSYDVSLDEVPASFVEDELGTNRLIPHWIDGQNGLILGSGRTALQLGPDVELADPLSALLRDDVQAQIDQNRFVVLDDGVSAIEPILLNASISEIATSQDQCLASDSIDGAGDEFMSDFGLAFVGWSDNHLSTGQPYHGISYWRVTDKTVPSPVIYVHVLDTNGNIIAQSDRFDVSHEQLQPGDVVVQLHRFDLPIDTIGPCQIALGLYRRGDFTRANFALTDGDTADRLFILDVERVD